MKKDCFGGPGQWYKGNLHSHTTNSDGHLTPAQAVALFRQYGYTFFWPGEPDPYTDPRAPLDPEAFYLFPRVVGSLSLVLHPKRPPPPPGVAALHVKNGPSS